MKTLHLFLLLSTASIVIMLVVDTIIGPEAEFLNAYSVLQRLLGQTPTAGDSFIAKRVGAAGEFVVVIMANLLVGGILTAAIRLFTPR